MPAGNTDDVAWIDALVGGAEYVVADSPPGPSIALAIVQALSTWRTEHSGECPASMTGSEATASV